MQEFKKYFLQTFVSYKGTISRRQFWLSLFVTCTLIACMQFLTLFRFYFSSGFSRGFSVDDSIIGLLVHGLLPMQTIVTAFSIYIIFNTSIKRGRTLGLSVVKSWIYAFGIYFFIFMFFTTYSAFLVLQEYIHAGLYEKGNFSLSLLIIVAMYVLWGLVSFILLSQKHDVDVQENDSEQNPNTSVQTMYKILVLQIVTIFFYWFLSFLLPDKRAAEFSNTIILLAFIGVFLYIMHKRVRDAGISPLWLFLPFVLFIAFFVLIVYLRYEQPVWGTWIYSLLIYSCEYIVILYSIFLNMLLIFPTKKTTNETLY